MDFKQFSFEGVIGFGWRVVTKNLWFFVGVMFAFLAISYAPAIIQIVLKRSSIDEYAADILRYAMMVACYIINFILAIGLIKIALSFCDERKPSFSTLFDFWGYFWKYVGGVILYILIIAAGCALLIVPGVIWMIKFRFWPYFVIDKGLGPIAALKASSRTTSGVKLELFGFMFMCGLIIIAGYICFFVGIFVAIPIVMIAEALVYRQLAAQTPELAVFYVNDDVGEITVNENF